MNRHMFISLLVLSATFSPCRAESITENSGRTYQDIIVTASTATHLTFTYKTADGMTAVAMVKRENLPESTQTKYSYDPSTASEQQTQVEPQPPDQKPVQPSAGKHAASTRKTKPETPKSLPVAPPTRVADEVSSSQTQPQAAAVRLTVLSGEPRIERDRKQAPVTFFRNGELVDAFGKVQFKFELQNLTTNPLKNLRFAIAVLDKQGKLSVAPVNGGATLDAKGKAEYSHEMMISYNEKSKSHPVEAYSIDVIGNRKVLLTETYPATAREMMDEKKSGSDDYGKWSGRPTPDGATGDGHARGTK